MALHKIAGPFPKTVTIGRRTFDLGIHEIVGSPS
jgi:hypothetical protein